MALLNRVKPSPALVEATRRRFFRLRSAVFRQIWPR
jgi:hypothetical protein